MGTSVQEQYSAYPVAANSTTPIAAGSQVGGFLCSVSGNAKIGEGADGASADVVSQFPVTAGVFHPIPCSVGKICALVLSGGAAGTLFATK